MLDRFYAFLDRPLYLWARVALLVVTVPLVLALTQPLWKISMKAPQYPGGLYMEIYTHKIDGGNNGQHIKEINTLNHYIGMRTIDRSELADLDWIPFALGLLIVLTLRCAAIGNVRTLVDLAVLSLYIGLFAFGRFVYKLYVFGHHLDPDAPLKIKPFTPAVFGTKQIANFSTSSYPQLGSILIGIFFAGVLGTLGWHLFAGRRQALRDAAAAAAAPEPAT
jgi:copper chaperone NosL